MLRFFLRITPYPVVYGVMAASVAIVLLVIDEGKAQELFAAFVVGGLLATVVTAYSIWRDQKLELLRWQSED